MVNPLVSIIIPTYNAARTLGETLESILSQPHPNTYEVIVVDDGSTDTTRNLIETYYANRVSYHYQPNSGRGAARNAGLKLAQGEFIQFFDADDIMEPNALQPRLDFLLAHPETAAAYGRSVTFYESQPNVTWNSNNWQFHISGDVLKTELHHPFLLPIMILLRREWAEKVGGMEESFKSNEDWHFWLKIAAAGGLFAEVEGTPVAKYRGRPKNSSELAMTHLYSGVLALEQIKPLVMNRADYSSLEFDKALGTWRYGYGYNLLKSGKTGQGRAEIWRSFGENRQSLPTKLYYLLLSYLFPVTTLESAFLRLRQLVHQTAP